MEHIKQYLQLSEKWLDNSLISGAVVIFFILFGGFLAPDLPHSLVKVFAHPLIKILFVLSILLLRKYSVTASVLLTIIFILLVQAVTKFSVERIAQKVQHDMEQAYKMAQQQINQHNQQIKQQTDQHDQQIEKQIEKQIEGQGQKTIGQFLNPLDPLPSNADCSHKYGKIDGTISLEKEIQELNPIYPVHAPNKYGAYGAYSAFAVSE